MATKKQTAAQEAAEDAALVEQDEIPFEVTDAVDPDEVGDLTGVKRDDTIPQSNDVPFVVSGAKVDIHTDATKDGGDGSTLLAKVLRLQVKVTDSGVDGSGAYAGKVLFLDLPLVLKADALKTRYDRMIASGAKKPGKSGGGFNIKWHAGISGNYELVDFKEFALATGIAGMVEDETTGQPKWKMTGPIDDSLLKVLAFGDVEFVANVSRRENVGMDRFENKLSRFRAPSSVEQEGRVS